MNQTRTFRFTFTSKSPSDTTILTPEGAPLYTVASSKVDKTTTVTRQSNFPGQGIPLISIRLSTWGTDRVTLRGRECPAKEWLTGHKTFVASSGRTYKWARKLSTYAYELRHPVSEEVFARPLAPSLGIVSGEKRKLPVLDVSEAVLPDLDDIVASYVYLSAKDEKAQKLGDGLGAAGEVAGAMASIAS